MAKIMASETQSLNPVHESLRQSLATLYADERGSVAKADGLQRLLRKHEAELGELPELQQHLGQLARALRHLEETERMLALKLEDARIQERREIQTFLVVDRASPAEQPSYPNFLLSVPAAGVLGLIAGMFYATFLGYMRALSYRARTFRAGWVSVSDPEAK